MCGILGLALVDEEASVAQALVDGLMILQHRGQDAAGIVTCYRGRLNLRKNPGPVSEVFSDSNMGALVGNLGVGHVRYPTAGGGLGRDCYQSRCALLMPLPRLVLRRGPAAVHERAVRHRAGAQR